MKLDHTWVISFVFEDEPGRDEPGLAWPQLLLGKKQAPQRELGRSKSNLTISISFSFSKPPLLNQVGAYLTK